ncbi:UNVERIFIED_CONTAM: putative mitochondrial protein [Sesamum angustifolium]|uniref:Mitochondrial protein n=1 Tax=Sesamum angustifolium TaxID=2727405 RepID=A0AAW2M840_9LAMI
MLNGSQFGYLCPERGIHQGDPLSPYLFILCAETLSCLIQDREATGHIKGVAVAKNAPRVSHLLFAHDTLIFCQATVEAMMSIRNILNIYGRASGQIINFDKSSITFSRNTLAKSREHLARILGVQVESCPTKYLDVPFLIGRSKRDIFSNVRDCVWQCVGGWKEKLLSQGARQAWALTHILWRSLANGMEERRIGFAIFERSWNTTNLTCLSWSVGVYGVGGMAR